MNKNEIKINIFKVYFIKIFFFLCEKEKLVKNEFARNVTGDESNGKDGNEEYRQ